MIGPDVNPFVELSSFIDKGVSKAKSKARGRAEHRNTLQQMEYAHQKHFEAMTMQHGHERDLQAAQHQHEASQADAQRQHEASEGAASRLHELERGRQAADIFGQHVATAVDAASGGTPIRVSHGDTTIEFERKRRTGGRQRNLDKD